MKTYITLFLLTVLFSCRDSQNPAKENNFDDNLMVGEWWLDSSSHRCFSRDRLILLEDGSFYLFSGSDGGSLRIKGKKISKDSLATEFTDTLKIHLVDSNRLCISGGWSNDQDFYERSGYGDYHEDLKEYLESDSLRKKTIGWWKLIYSKMPVELINYQGYTEKFTLNIREDGQAVFYLENNLDSMVNYSYKVNRGGIDFNRGCIVDSDCKVSFDGSGRMKLLLNK